MYFGLKGSRGSNRRAGGTIFFDLWQMMHTSVGHVVEQTVPIQTQAVKQKENYSDQALGTPFGVPTPVSEGLPLSATF